MTTDNVKRAAELLIGEADNTGNSLVNLIAQMEHYIVNETKAGLRDEPPQAGRRYYRIVAGRLIEE